MRILNDEAIGNALQSVCEDEQHNYYCSDTTIISCINCNPVAKAQYRQDIRDFKELLNKLDDLPIVKDVGEFRRRLDKVRRELK